MNILPFDTAYYSNKKKEITDQYNLEDQNDLLPLSGTIIREQLRSNGIVSDYILEKSIKKLIETSFSIKSEDLFYE